MRLDARDGREGERVGLESSESWRKELVYRLRVAKSKCSTEDEEKSMM